MQNIWLMLSSITYAIKAQNLLGRNGIPSTFLKTPIHRNGGRGCGYSIRILRRDYVRAMDLLRAAGIKVLGEYTEEAGYR